MVVDVSVVSVRVADVVVDAAFGMFVIEAGDCVVGASVSFFLY